MRCVYRVTGIRTLNEIANTLTGRIGIGLQYMWDRSGPMASAPSQLGAFAKSHERFDTPNLQYHVQPLSLDKFGEPLHPYPAFTASVCNLRPESRGTIHTASRNPVTAPKIKPNYLASDADAESCGRGHSTHTQNCRSTRASGLCPRRAPSEAWNPQHRRGLSKRRRRYRHNDLSSGRHLQNGQ